ncbi:hypothetical protein [Aquimarina aggregata]|uniref:hypothetical protein n=1 Tax=Aquimarina aggregata TaxID=1642818 RepID=UPI0024900E7A|nr:hypothetical protein [Aquimarina aggregata]
MKLFKNKKSISEKMKSKSPLAWVALILIIVGAVSFSNHPTIGYTVLGIGFLLGAYVDFFLKKKKKPNNQ